MTADIRTPAQVTDSEIDAAIARRRESDFTQVVGIVESVVDALYSDATEGAVVGFIADERGELLMEAWDMGSAEVEALRQRIAARV